MLKPTGRNAKALNNLTLQKELQLLTLEAILYSYREFQNKLLKSSHDVVMHMVPEIMVQTKYSTPDSFREKKDGSE